MFFLCDWLTSREHSSKAKAGEQPYGGRNHGRGGEVDAEIALHIQTFSRLGDLGLQLSSGLVKLVPLLDGAQMQILNGLGLRAHT
jgi:hypothetical protein